MTVTIDGLEGPNTLDMPGGYGKNASHNLMLFEVQALDALDETGRHRLLEMTLRYTPAEQLAFDNAFAFAEAEIDRLKTHPEAVTLDREALIRLFGGNEAFADQYLHVADRNGDGQVDVLEYTAFLLFSDDASNLIAGTLDAFCTPGSPLYDEHAQTELSTMAAQFRSNFPTQLDGAVTPAGRLVSDVAVLSLPTFTGFTLDRLLETLQLETRYATYRQKRAN